MAAAAAAPLVEWRNSRAWMEPMRGERWQQRLELERGVWERTVAAAAAAAGGPEAVEAAVTAFRAAEEEVDAAAEWSVDLGRAGTLYAVPQSGGGYRWRWGGDTPAVAARRPLVGDIALSGGGSGGGSGLMAYTTDESGGGEQYCVTVVDIRGATKRRLWTSGGSPAGIAPRVALFANRCGEIV